MLIGNAQNDQNAAYKGDVQYKQLDVEFAMQPTEPGECGAVVYSSRLCNLKHGDVIVGASGIGVTDMYHLYWIVQNLEGDDVQLQVLRKTESGEALIEVREALTQQSKPQIYSLFGVIVRATTLNHERAVLKVLHLEVDSPFARWLRVGDVILGVSGEVFVDVRTALEKMYSAVQQHKFAKGVLTIDLLRDETSMRQNMTLDFEAL